MTLPQPALHQAGGAARLPAAPRIGILRAAGPEQLEYKDSDVPSLRLLRRLLPALPLAVLAAPLLAQPPAQPAAQSAAQSSPQSSVTLYGWVDVSVERIALGDLPPGAADSVQRLSSNISNFGVRGVEAISPQIEAWFQVERQFAVDTGSETPQFRNTGAGLRGPWGTLLAGHWDTPLAFQQVRADPWTGRVAQFSIIGSPGFGVSVTSQAANAPTGTPGAASYQRRQSDSLQYWTPSLAGFSGRAMVSFAEAKTAASSPRTAGFSAEWLSGPWWISVAGEQHDDVIGLNAIRPITASTSRDRAARALVQRAFGPVTASVIWERLDYRADVTSGVRQWKRDALAATLRVNLGPGQLRATFTRADDGSCTELIAGACGNTADTGGSQMVLGYVYPLSRRTELYALAMRLANESANRYVLGTTVFVPTTTQPLGADLRVLALGMRAMF
jgi:predicted porin